MPTIEPRPLRNGAIEWMAGNSVAANLLMLVLLIGGVIMGLHIKQEVFPEFDLDRITVSVPYPGASPEEVEKGILLSIEEAARGLDDVKEVTSVASEGQGVVTVEVLQGGNVQRLAQDLQNEVDRITTFPEDAEQPQVVIESRRREVISLVVYGQQEEDVLKETAELIRERLQRDPGITLVDLQGARPYEISIEVPQQKLREHGLTLDDIAARVRAASIELPGGGVKTPGGEVLIRMKERRDFGREFERIPIVSRPDGTQLRLEDMATVVDGFEDIDRFQTYNGLPAMLVTVYRVGDETPIKIAKTVRRHVVELDEALPPGVRVAVWRDFSEIYAQRAELLLQNASIGLVLVLVLLSLFLEIRLAFWVTMGIPVSFLGAFLFLPMFGISLNMISLFAFIISLGIVVDDAIVVGENVYEHRQRGDSFARSAALGAREVALPVTFSVLTNMVAFMPMLFVPGFMGKVFKVIPVVVLTVFFISLIECLFVLPAHLAHSKEPGHRGFGGWLHRKQQAFSHRFSRFISTKFGPFLHWSMHHRYLTCAVALFVLIVAVGYVRSGRLGMELFPRVEADYAYATAILPYGSSVDRTKAVQDRLITAAKAIAKENGGDELVQGIFAQVGAAANRGSGGHVTEVGVSLTPPEVRPMSTAAFIAKWRERVGSLPGLESLVYQFDRGGPGSGAALTVELSHTSLDILERACKDLAGTLADYPIVKDIDDGFAPGKEQLDFTIRPEGQSLGLTAREVARQVRNAFYGSEVVRQQRGRDEMKIMVRLPESERASEYNIEELIVRAPNGTEVPLREVVDVSRGRAYTSIDRRDGRRVVTVSADVTPPSQAGRILDSLKADALPRLQARYPGLTYGFEGRQAEQRESMSSLYTGFILAMLVIYALLAIPFRSYAQPLIIMVSIPFGLVGAILGHIIMGYSLSILSMFGIVALSGVVVNDALILIDFANRASRSGMTHADAIHAAAVRRFRPIMLTTLTTFGGLAPMIFETSRQARFLIPMAISLGYGILFSTAITLALVPCLYLILDDLRDVFSRAMSLLLGHEPDRAEVEATRLDSDSPRL